MRFAYADPPYLGCGSLYSRNHPDALAWNDPATHAALIKQLCADYPDGWAVSCSTPSLRTLLPMCPPDVRIGSWTKPFCSFKPGVPVAYAWEPVVFRGGRRRGRDQPTVRDWVSCNITLKKGLTGVKPSAVCLWIFDLLGADPSDELVDLFPGSGAVGAAWAQYCQS
jgi:hypothetical protein